MTLDEARDAFEANPNPDTAAAYLWQAAIYCADNIIADHTYHAIRAECAPYLGELGTLPDDDEQLIQD